MLSGSVHSGCLFACFPPAIVLYRALVMHDYSRWECERLPLLCFPGPKNKSSSQKKMSSLGSDPAVVCNQGAVTAEPPRDAVKPGIALKNKPALPLYNRRVSMISCTRLCEQVTTGSYCWSALNLSEAIKYSASCLHVLNVNTHVDVYIISGTFRTF